VITEFFLPTQEHFSMASGGMTDPTKKNKGVVQLD
jgi:hypothetical protein